MTSDLVRQAAEIVNDIRALRVQQCVNCGLAFHNGYETHNPKGLWIFKRPQCQYNPVGWESADPSEEDS